MKSYWILTDVNCFCPSITIAIGFITFLSKKYLFSYTILTYFKPIEINYTKNIIEFSTNNSSIKKKTKSNRTNPVLQPAITTTYDILLCSRSKRQ